MKKLGLILIYKWISVEEETFPDEQQCYWQTCRKYYQYFTVRSFWCCWWGPFLSCIPQSLNWCQRTQKCSFVFMCDMEKHVLSFVLSMLVVVPFNVRLKWHVENKTKGLLEIFTPIRVYLVSLRLFLTSPLKDILF